jgi:hypothetical protein
VCCLGMELSVRFEIDESRAPEGYAVLLAKFSRLQRLTKPERHTLEQRDKT